MTLSRLGQHALMRRLSMALLCMAARCSTALQGAARRLSRRETDKEMDEHRRRRRAPNRKRRAVGACPPRHKRTRRAARAPSRHYEEPSTSTGKRPTRPTRAASPLSWMRIKSRRYDI